MYLGIAEYEILNKWTEKTLEMPMNMTLSTPRRYEPEPCPDSDPECGQEDCDPSDSESSMAEHPLVGKKKRRGLVVSGRRPAGDGFRLPNAAEGTANKSKIKLYGLEQMAYRLLCEGKTTYQVAALLSVELRNRGLDDMISQATVHRYAAVVRAEQSGALQSRVSGAVAVDIDDDIGNLGRLLKLYMDTACDGSAYDIKVRLAAARDAQKLIFDKIELGLGGPQSKPLTSMEAILTEINSKTKRGVAVRIQHGDDNPDADSDCIDADDVFEDTEG